MESVLVDRSPLGLRTFAATKGVPVSVTDLLPLNAPHFSLPCAPRPHQSPLLPLPPRNPVPLPSPSKRPRAHQQNKRKPRCQSVTPTKDPKAKAIAVASRAPLQRLVKVEVDENDSRCIDFLQSVYSKSPPPSSLPLPRFPLTKPKSEGSTKAGLGEVQGGICGGGVDAGATDGLRRLLGI
ncbi:hypothetical protein B296_00033678 [Ensete ventricosum]|uniref:Uncharacterized protein n=1 Tax=Ensete ventricosum TaxID=4639 RepID=A0A427AAB3_ENSVE|nr:hypothetical protein B296_00033678 [Ensete ventricosum]